VAQHLAEDHDQAPGQAFLLSARQYRIRPVGPRDPLQKALAPSPGIDESRISYHGTTRNFTAGIIKMNPRENSVYLREAPW